jgi:hypothetical protein
VPISAKIIADSRCFKTHRRITTMEIRYPRIVHAEFMTHRVFSRNASSSRAIPVAKLIEEARTNPAMPVRFGANQRGMQDKGGNHEAAVEVYMGGVTFRPMDPEEAWRFAAKQAADVAESFDDAGYHKQVVNRLLEPFTHISVVVTSTDWANFFALRRHADADPTMKALADAMWDAQNSSVPQLLPSNCWHLPYVGEDEWSAHGMKSLLIMSAARCARVSYNKHDGSSPSFEDDLALYEKLVTSELVHASPLEHQALPDPDNTSRDLWGNFTGFTQYRKTVPNEAIHDVR